MPQRQDQNFPHYYSEILGWDNLLVRQLINFKLSTEKELKTDTADLDLDPDLGWKFKTEEIKN